MSSFLVSALKGRCEATVASADGNRCRIVRVATLFSFHKCYLVGWILDLYCVFWLEGKFEFWLEGKICGCNNLKRQSLHGD